MILRQFSIFIVLLFLVGCATTGAVLLTGDALDPIDPSLVKLYQDEPNTKFKYLGIVKSESELIFSQQKALDRAVEELKRQAAQIGANGVILIELGDKQRNYSIYIPSSKYGGSFYSGSSEYETLQGAAIYVEEEPGQ